MRIDVNGHAPEVRQVMKELVAHLLRHPMTLGDRQASPHAHTHVDMEPVADPPRSEEHTSELQSPCNLVCRLLLEKKNPSSRVVMNSASAWLSSHPIGRL